MTPVDCSTSNKYSGHSPFNHTTSIRLAESMAFFVAKYGSSSSVARSPSFSPLCSFAGSTVYVSHSRSFPSLRRAAWAPSWLSIATSPATGISAGGVLGSISVGGGAGSSLCLYWRSKTW